MRGPFFVLRKIARIWLPTARYIEIDVQSSIDAIKKDLLSNGLADTFSGLTTKGGGFSKCTLTLLPGEKSS